MSLEKPRFFGEDFFILGLFNLIETNGRLKQEQSTIKGNRHGDHLKFINFLSHFLSIQNG